MATSSFGKAFRAARAAGEKTFTFNGKKYTTDLAPDPNSVTKSVGEEPEFGKQVPRRTPGPLTDVDVPGTRTRYENKEDSDMTYAKGGSVSASKRADGIAQRGKTRGTMVMCGGGMAKGK